MSRFLVLVAVLPVAAFLMAGCGRIGFLGNRYNNFTAYYNTFYNAENAFDDGVEGVGVGTRSETIDADQYLPLFGRVDRIGQTQPFNDAIQKSADVLREHPDSKWVDDALLLIGKSYFYLQNYVGAEQKFREVMSLGSRLEDEARFWLARALIASGPAKYELAADHLAESLARDDLSQRWESQMRLALAELYVQRGAWEDAVTELEAGLERLGDKELAARAYFLLGQLRETQGRYDAAVEAYDRVSDFNPFYELDYEAQINAIRVEGRYGDAEDALRRLRRMERDDKHYASRAELAYLRGRIYQAEGRGGEALDTYYELLYDFDANISDVRGRVHYALGEFYRDVLSDYTLAGAYFDTAATVLRNPAVRGGSTGAAGQPVHFAPAAIMDAPEQARIFGSVADVEATISRMDSLLYLGSLDDATFDSVILDMRRQRAAELAAQQAALERRRAEQGFQQAAASGFDARGQGGKQGVTNTASSGEAGFLFHKDPIRVQENYADFVAKWGDRPLAPNWRRLDAITHIASENGGDADGALGDGESPEGIGLPEIDVSGVPRDPESKRSMRAERALARYELGNVLFLSVERPDSAATWYRLVIEEDGDEQVAQRAYYALAEVQRALGDTLAAERIDRTTLEQYPDSDFARRIRERLGLATGPVAQDSLTQAESAYDRYYDAWRRAEYEASLNGMVETAARFRDTGVAPRSLLAAGKIYMEWAVRDSLSLFDPLPLTVPDSLLLVSGLLKIPEVVSDSAAAPPTVPRTPGAVQAGDTPPKKVIDTPAATPPQDTPSGRSGQIGAPAVLPDTLAAPPVADSLRTAPDGVASDSLVARLDATAVDSAAVDSAAVDSAVVAPPEPEPVRLETLFQTLIERYPRSPHVAQARRILVAIDERRPVPEVPVDSSLVARADSTQGGVVADSTEVPSVEDAGRPRQLDASDLLVQSQQQRRQLEARADSTGVPTDSTTVTEGQTQQERIRALLDERQQRMRDRPRPPAADTLAADTLAADTLAADTLAAAADSSRVPAPPPAAPVVQPSPDPGAPGITYEQREQGGWTLIVHDTTMEQEANQFIRNFQRALRGVEEPVDLFMETDEEGTLHYRVGLGFFETEQGAQEAFARLKERLPGSTVVHYIPPLE